MRPILFQWRGLIIWSYPAMLYVGLVTAVVEGNAAAHATRLDAFRVYITTLILIPAGLVGARLMYVARHWQIYGKNPRRIWNRSEGGAEQYGGFLVVLPLSVPVVGALGLGLGSFWDAAVFTVLVVMVFGRIGCLLNGCCAGRPSKSRFSMYLPNHNGAWERRIPSQILEATWAAVLLVCAIAVRRWMPFPGALFLAVTAGYAAARLVLESTRERRSGAARFTIHHGISATLIAFSLAMLAARWPR